VQFEPDAIRLLATLSHGSPRRLNLLCDRALEEGRAAGTAVIGVDLVERSARATGDAVAELAVTHEPIDGADPDVLGAADRPRWWARRSVWLPAAGIVLAAGLGAGYWGWSIASADPGMPARMPRPVMRVGKPASALPVPSDDEIRSLLDGTWVGEETSVGPR